jgi:endoglycosylceramidase
MERMPSPARTRVVAAALALGLLVGAGLRAAPAPARATLRPVSTHGRWLVDAEGRTLLLHGLNVVAKRPPYTPESIGFGADDAAFLAAHGFDAVRLGVIYAGVEPHPGVYHEAYLGAIARTVRVLRAHGIRSLLDFHQDQYSERFQGQGFPGWAVQDGGLPNPRLGFPGNYVGNPALQHAFDRFFANARGPGGVGLDDRYAAAWRHVARRFAHTPGILGYDLINEPSPGSLERACLSAAGCAGFERHRLTRFYEKVSAAVRRGDGSTPIFYEPVNSFGIGFPTSLPRLADRHAVFGWHLYLAAAAQRAQFARAAAHSAGQEPQFLTEFGSTTATATIRHAEDLADRHLLGWMEWTYFSNGATDNAGTPSLVDDPHRAPTGANVDRGQLAALVRPHASAIAGTPTRESYDAATRVLSVRFQPRPGVTAPTRILLPAAVFPKGRRVRVHRGVVLSDRAGVLTVRNVGAGPVSVVVRPRQ